jgi:hypothetical protein
MPVIRAKLIVVGAPGQWRPLSVTTDLGYDSSLFLFIIITKNTNIS